MAHFFMSVGGSKFHERLAHFFIDIYTVRGATTSFFFILSFFGFQSTLPVRGATPLFRRVNRLGFISIYAPREGSDLVEVCVLITSSIISIHAPREGSDHRPPPRQPG